MKKYIILIAAVLMQLCLGASYAWSTFVPVLKQSYGFSIAQTQTIFGTAILMITLFMFVGGRLQDKIGPRIPTLCGGIIFGASYIFAGYSSGTYLALFTFIGISNGIGVGLCYLCPIVCAVKWFPNHKSLVTGIVVSGYAGSAIIISLIGEYLISQQTDVLTIFKYMGFFFLAIVTITSLFLQNPPAEENIITDKPHIKTLALLKDRNFWGLLCAIFPGLCIGLMSIGNIKPFGLSLNLNPIFAGAAVTILAISNATGRLGWGIIGGLVAGKKAILLSLISTAVMCLATPFVVQDAISFQIFAVAAGFNYGACLVLYAAEIAHTYGAQRMGTIYSTLFLSNGIAGIMAPPLAGKIFDLTGSYSPAFLIFGSLSFISIFLFYFIYQPDRIKK
jgi:OFA family oxalate/formate antiporter-like MFS transporter